MGAPQISTSVERDSTLPRYIEDMVDQFRRLVPGERYRELRYLLDMAKMSARQTADEIEASQPVKPRMRTPPSSLRPPIERDRS